MLNSLYTSFTSLLTAIHYLFFDCILAISLYSVILASRCKTDKVKYVYIDRGFRVDLVKEQLSHYKKEVANLSSIIEQSQDASLVAAAESMKVDLVSAIKSATYYQHEYNTATQQIKKLEFDIRTLNYRNDYLSSRLASAIDTATINTATAATNASTATAISNATAAITTITATTAITPTDNTSAIITPATIFFTPATNVRSRSGYLFVGKPNNNVKINRKGASCYKSRGKRVNRLACSCFKGIDLFKAARSCVATTPTVLPCSLSCPVSGTAVVPGPLAVVPPVVVSVPSAVDPPVVVSGPPAASINKRKLAPLRRRLPIGKSKLANCIYPSPPPPPPPTSSPSQPSSSSLDEKSIEDEIQNVFDEWDSDEEVVKDK